jgi:phosphopantetheinyl transferase
MGAESSGTAFAALDFDPQIRVWTVAFTHLRAYLGPALSALSAQEAIRYRAFGFAEDAERFVLGRWFLRAALCAWPTYHVKPDALPEISAVQFSERTGQLPLAKIDGREISMKFSLSRSRRAVAAAVGNVRALGVDLEDDDRARDFSAELICQFFHLSEQVYFAESEDKVRNEMLLASWTGKEAIVKAAGMGLLAPVQAIHLQGETIVALPPMLGPKEQCQLRLRKQTGASLAVAWW